MKTFSNLRTAGFAGCISGQRNVVVAPQVIACSTEGGFRITPPVSRALGVANGDNIYFVNNIDFIDKAIAEKDPDVVAFCEAEGLELGTPEAAIAIHKEFDQWGITKGFPEKDTKGNVKTCVERLSKKDKMRFVSQHFDEMLQAASESADQEVIDALNREGITVDEQTEILSAFVTPRELPKYSGSKTANPANLNGVGVTLNFTDTNIWKQLKADLGENATKFNRVYDVDVNALVDAQLSDGYELIDVKLLLLGEYKDNEPSRLGKEE